MTTAQPNPPLAPDELVSTGSEREVLEAFLNFHRQVLIRKVGKNKEINAIVGKAFCILGQAELCEPIFDLLHWAPPSDSTVIRSGPAGKPTTCADLVEYASAIRATARDRKGKLCA